MAETVLDAAAPRLRPQAPWQASRGGPGKNHEGLALGGTSPLDLEDGLRPKLPQRQRPRKAVAQKKRLAPGPQGDTAVLYSSTRATAANTMPATIVVSIVSRNGQRMARRMRFLSSASQSRTKSMLGARCTCWRAR
jgi:hypothetical protein